MINNPNDYIPQDFYGRSVPSVPLSWFETWKRALTRPTSANFDELVNDSGASFERACLWVFIAAFIGYALTMTGQVLISLVSNTQNLSNIIPGNVYGENMGPWLAAAMVFCGAPVIGALAVLGLLINAGVSHWLAKALGGMGDFSSLVYAYATFQAPLILLTYLLNLIPLASCLTFPLSLYPLLLSVLAVKAVHHLDWSKSIVAGVSLSILLFVLTAVIIIGALVLGLAGNNSFINGI